IEPHQTDNLTTYAKKLISHYHIQPNSIVIGNSLGGMLAIEIAKLISLQKVILISSMRTVAEAPWYFHLFKILPVYKLIPSGWMTKMRFLIRLAFGKMSAGDLWLFQDMLKNTSPKFLKWSMGAVLHWTNTTIPPNVYQVSGDKDVVFPYKKFSAAEIVPGGTHIMLFDKAKQVNQILKRILSQ
ncbi:MAG TPA: alpha/beta hydrolase, partial [Mucilaginibacter sp.]|nr:alpha/beta hydrolase [Mucilaginibacter sp.]